MKKNKISFILSEIAKLPEKQRAENLRLNMNEALKTVLVGMFHPGVNWILPPGAPPFTPCEFDNPGGLYQCYTKFKYFVAGGGDNIHPVKRERMFVDILETLEPDEANLVIAMKDKTSPWPEITYKLVNKAMPGLLPNEKKD